MAQRTLQQRITFNSFLWGSLITLAIVAVDMIGWLKPFEYWLYDVRAARCQTFTPQPSKQIVYLDIDDNTLDTIGRWPWHRSMMARILEEVRLATPGVVGIDILYSEPEKDRDEKKGDQYLHIVEDPALSESMKQLDNVILANSFTFSSATNQKSETFRLAVDLLKTNPTLKPQDISRILNTQSKSANYSLLVIEQEYPDARRSAIRRSIHELLSKGLTDLDQITQTVVAGPSTQSSSANLIDTTLRTIIAAEYQHVLSERWMESQSIQHPDKLKIAPPDAEFENLPIPLFCDSIEGSGFANYSIFTEPIVRSVPLFLKRGNRLYPQFAFETTCRFLGIDLDKARFTDRSVILQVADGEINIPVRAQHSSTIGRDVGLIMDIPWFGTHQWETMHDWPEYRNFEQHYNIQIAWGIVEAKKRLASNNALIDTTIKAVLELALLDTETIALYDARKFRSEDYIGRKTFADKTIQSLKENNLLDWASPANRAELKKSDEIILAENIYALTSAVEQNSSLMNEIQQMRQDLAAKLKGKLVLIGLTATATGDFVTTSLHTRCPGVVVHGVIANAMINREFLRSAPDWVAYLVTLVLGLGVVWITSRFPPIRTSLLSTLLAVAFLIVNGFLFYDRWNWIVKAAPTLTAIVVCWSTCMVVRLILESMERIRLKRESAIIEHEITLAQQVQAALIPKELAIISSVDSHGWTLAATTTGGDCFDLWRLADGRLGILVADASGHGLGPSIVVSQVRALVRALCDLYKEPQNLLERINQRMTEDLEGKKFCTTFVGFLATDGTLSWGSAGHGPMLWAESIDAEPQEIGGTAMPLGVSIDYFGDESVPPIQLGAGGWLAVVSDGIFEASDPTGDQFGVDRIKTSINKALHGNCVDVIEMLRKDVLAFQAKPTPDDDQTIVFIKVKDIQPISGNPETSPETQEPDVQPDS